MKRKMPSMLHKILFRMKFALKFRITNRGFKLDDKVYIYSIKRRVEELYDNGRVRARNPVTRLASTRCRWKLD